MPRRKWTPMRGHCHTARGALGRYTVTPRHHVTEYRMNVTGMSDAEIAAVRDTMARIDALWDFIDNNAAGQCTFGTTGQECVDFGVGGCPWCHVRVLRDVALRIRIQELHVPKVRP